MNILLKEKVKFNSLSKTLLKLAKQWLTEIFNSLGGAAYHLNVTIKLFNLSKTLHKPRFSVLNDKQYAKP